MSDLTDKFTSFQEEVAINHTALMDALAVLQSAFDALASDVVIIKDTMPLNASNLLGAISQTGACFPCPTPSIIVPPLDTTTNPINEDRCKRGQAFIATIHNILAGIDTMQSYNVIGTFNVVNDAISEVISGVAAGDTVPLPSFPETVQIVGNYLSYAAERIFSGVSLIDQFGPLESDLSTAMTSAGTAGSALSAYNGVIDGASLSLAGGYLVKAVAYSALVSYFFDPGTAPDLSGYDGTACGIVDCFTFVSISSSVNGSGVEAVAWSTPFAGENNDGSGATSPDLLWTRTNFVGYTFTATNNARVFTGGGGFYDILAAVPFVIPTGTDHVAVVMTGGSPHMTVDICPP